MSEREDAVFQALIAAAADGIIGIDAAGHIQVFNPACERLFGYRPEEVIGKRLTLLVPSPYAAEHDGHAKLASRETLGRRKDGSTFPIYLSIGQGKSDGADITVGIVHDLTGRGAATLMNTSLVSAMGQMGSTLAHELNQPLAAIMNYAKAAQRTMEPVEDPRAVKAKDLIVKAGEQITRAGNIIRNLRDFIGRREGSRGEEKLHTIIEEAIALGLVGAADSNVKVTMALDPALPAVVVDRAQIQQAVINLIRNALEAMQPGPVRQLDIACGRGEAGFIEVTVSDTGPGFSENMASRAFQPFVTSKEKGMGLGLTICQSIINAHGGKLWSTPRDGGGISFHFQLPLAEKTDD